MRSWVKMVHAYALHSIKTLSTSVLAQPVHEDVVVRRHMKVFHE